MRPYGMHGVRPYHPWHFFPRVAVVLTNLVVFEELPTDCTLATRCYREVFGAILVAAIPCMAKRIHSDW
jgi:hypothetical protein